MYLNNRVIYYRIEMERRDTTSSRIRVSEEGYRVKYFILVGEKIFRLRRELF